MSYTANILFEMDDIPRFPDSDPAVIEVVQALAEALVAGNGHPDFTSVLTGGTPAARTDVLDLLADVATQHGWLVMAETGTAGVVRRLHLGADSLRQAVNASSKIGYGLVGRSPSLRYALQSRDPALPIQGEGLLITISDCHLMPPAELIEICHTIQHVTARTDHEVMWVLAGDNVLPRRFMSLPGIAFMTRSGHHQLPTVTPTRSEARTANAQRWIEATQELVDAGGMSVAEFALAYGLSEADGLVVALDYQHACRLVVARTPAGEDWIPRCLLDEHDHPDPAWEPVMKLLLRDGDSAWDVWIAIATPSTWLDDRIAADVIRTDPDRVVAAMRQRIASRRI